MKRTLLLSGLFLLAGAGAQGEPLTLAELKQALAAQGAKAMTAGEQDGRPLLSGEMQAQPFEVLLGDCRGPQPTCEAVRYAACHDLPDHSHLEALDIANDWNAGDRPGVIWAQEEWFGEALCLKLQQALLPETVYGVPQIAVWQIELGDFLQRIEDALVEKQAANRLDNTAQ